MFTRTEAVKLVKREHVLYAAAFLLPLLLNHPQVIVGSMVNALLLISSTRLSKKHLVPLSILPSLSALLNNVLFGSFTPYLLFFLPFIWTGNWVMMSVFSSNSMNVLLRSILALLLKVSLLFAVVNVFVNLHLVPVVFLQAMGAFQFLTGALGAVLALAILKLTSGKTQ